MSTKTLTTLLCAILLGGCVGTTDAQPLEGSSTTPTSTDASCHPSVTTVCTCEGPLAGAGACPGAVALGPCTCHDLAPEAVAPANCFEEGPCPAYVVTSTCSSEGSVEPGALCPRRRVRSKNYGAAAPVTVPACDPTHVMLSGHANTSPCETHRPDSPDENHVVGAVVIVDGGEGIRHAVTIVSW